MDLELALVGNQEHENEEEEIIIKQDDEDVASLSAMLNDFNWSNDNVENAARIILNADSGTKELVDAVMLIKKLLCTTRDAVFMLAQEVIDSGIISKLVEFIGSKDASKELKLQSAFCLTNIAAGTDQQTSCIVKAGAVPYLIELLDSYDQQLRRQALFCLANVAGSTPEYRIELAANTHYFNSISSIILEAQDTKIEELACWNLRNLLVLGGPEIKNMTKIIELFIKRIVYFIPEEINIPQIISDGTASLAGVHHNTTNWFKFGPLDSNIYLPHHSAYTIGNTQLLRFIAESFAFISNDEYAAKLLNAKQNILILTYLAKFSYHSSIRTYSLETITNMLRCITDEQGVINITNEVIKGLAELLADGYTYSNYLRELSACALFYIIYNETSDIFEWFNASVCTREAYLNLFKSVPKYYDLHPQELNRYSIASESKLYLASVVDIVSKIYYQYHGPETTKTREYAAKIIVCALRKLPNNVLKEIITQPLVELLLEITELIFETMNNTMYKITKNTYEYNASIDMGIHCLYLFTKLLELDNTPEYKDNNFVAQLLYINNNIEKLKNYSKYYINIDNTYEKFIHLFDQYH